MKPNCLQVILTLLWLAQACALAADYHLDKEFGNDAEDGGRAHPWQSIAKANSVSLRPGDRLLFRGGQTFAGNLLIGAGNAGTPEQPVIVGSYGDGRARINAGLGYAVLVRNGGGVEVRDLVCAGADRRRNQGAGVAFINTLPGNQRLRHVRIRSIESHGFGRELLKPKTVPEGYQLPQGAGILVASGASDGSKSGFEDIEISDCECRDNAYYGILIILVNLSGMSLVSVRQDTPAIIFQGNLYWTTGSAFAHSDDRSIPSLEAWRTAGKDCMDEKPVGRFANPQLNLARPRGLEGDLSRLASRRAFVPAVDSPARNAGLDLASLFKLDTGTRDFANRTLDSGQRLAAGAVITAP